MEVFLDKSFDSKSIPKYNLNLKIGEDFFIAGATKSKQDLHIAIAENGFKSELKDGFQIGTFIESLKKCPVKISKKYNQVSISIANTYFAIVPKALFQKENLKSYIELNAKVANIVEYRFQILEKEGIVVCFALPKELSDWINQIFPKAKITHEISVVIQSVLRDFHSLSESKVVLNIHKGHFDLMFLSKGKLEFVNSFPFSEKEDLLYFVLFTLEQLNLDPHEIEVFLLGEIKKGSEQHQLLFQYIKNIHFGSRNKNIKISNGLNEIPNHYFYSVFNQSLCV